MPKPLLSLFLAPGILLLTGCPSPPKPPSKITPILPVTQPTPAPQATTPTPTPAPAPAPATTTPSLEPAKSIVPLPPPVSLSIPRDRWVPWELWNLQRGLERPKRLNATSNPTFESRLANGLIALTIGSRMARWNGLGLALGFSPHLTNGQPYVHGLDLIKNIEPLLGTPRLREKGSRLIVVDPGHGGENTGAKCAVNTAFEKDYTLDWALRLQRLLATNGWNVLLTRTRDIDVSLAGRVAFAEKAKADLFVSLHFNSVSGGALRAEHGGVETYCLTPLGMPSYLTRDFVDDPTQYFPNNGFDTQNLQYAVRIHQSLIRLTQRRDRGVRRARFMAVLRGQNRPAVLIEGGYLSDPEEARLIESAEYRQKLAEALAQAITD